jgi:serine/threonine protein kinase
MLEALTFAHHAGLLHCALTPNHVLIHAKSHLGQLIDWTASCRIGSGDKIPYVDEGRFPGYFPPEILDRDGVPGPSSDIYMSTWCMVYLLGGEPRERGVPARVEEPIRAFLNRCLQPKSARRPRSAEIAFNEFREISVHLFGARKFVELIMPGA